MIVAVLSGIAVGLGCGHIAQNGQFWLNPGLMYSYKRGEPC